MYVYMYISSINHVSSVIAYVTLIPSYRSYHRSSCILYNSLYDPCYITFSARSCWKSPFRGPL